MRIFFALLSFGFSLTTAGAATVPGASILVLGDQQILNSFGQSLDASLRTMPGEAVHTVAACGSSPRFWIDGGRTDCGFFEKTAAGVTRSENSADIPALKTVLAQVHPKYTVVITGTAQLGNSEASIQKSMEELTAAIRAGGSSCLWIGPAFGQSQSAAVASYFRAATQTAEKVDCAMIDQEIFDEIANDPEMSIDLVKEMIHVAADDE